MIGRPVAPSRMYVFVLTFYVIVFIPINLKAQTSFEATIDLAQKNSSRVKMAQDDLQHASAALRESKDYYIPSLALSGGLGKTYGISLTVPTIFTVTSQSLVYGAGQRDYIRAAHSTLEAAEWSLRDARQQAEEDAVLTCISLAEALKRREILTQESQFAAQIAVVSEKRGVAGLESDLEQKKSRRAALQIAMQQPQVESEIAALKEHLKSLTGVNDVAFLDKPEDFLQIAVTPTDLEASIEVDSNITLSSQATARARTEQARGDARSYLRPQVLMQSQYGRISPINNVSDYYNLHGHYNVALFGIAIQFPLFDKARSAKAQEAAADAAHARHESESTANQQRENRLRMQSSVDELEKKAELAQLDRDIAAAQRKAIVQEVSTASAEITGRQMNPKDELYARMEEQQRYLDWITSLGQLRRAQISLMRQNGKLDSWVYRLPVLDRLSRPPYSTKP